MKISVLLASNDSLDYNLIDVMRVLNTTFDELGEKLNFIKLDQKNIPPFSNNYPVSDVANIVNQLSNSDGVIFACTSYLFAPNSIMQNFLDYLSLPIYRDFLKDKNCFNIVVSNENGEVETAQYLSKIVQYFGGYAPIVTAINKQISSQFNSNKDVSTIFEKQVEDYYRILRQNRKFFVTKTSFSDFLNINSQSLDGFSFNPNQQPMPQQAMQQMPQQQVFQQQPQPYQEQGYSHQMPQEQYSGVPNFDASQHIQEKLDVSQASSLTNRAYIPEPLQPQENSAMDFSYIENQNDTSFLNNNEFAGQNNDNNYSQRNNDFNFAQNQANGFDMGASQAQTQMPSMAENKGSVRQLTENLVNNFKPHLSNGLVTEIQLKITGEESFDGYFQINGANCAYHDGNSNTSDVTIIATSAVWQEVLDGKITAQKGFMTGQFKVRGNFVILPRFDQLFG